MLPRCLFGDIELTCETDDELAPLFRYVLAEFSFRKSPIRRRNFRIEAEINSLELVSVLCNQRERIWGKLGVAFLTWSFLPINHSGQKLTGIQRQVLVAQNCALSRCTEAGAVL